MYIVINSNYTLLIKKQSVQKYLHNLYITHYEYGNKILCFLINVGTGKNMDIGLQKLHIIEFIKITLKMN